MLSPETMKGTGYRELHNGRKPRRTTAGVLLRALVVVTLLLFLILLLFMTILTIGNRRELNRLLENAEKQQFEEFLARFEKTSKYSRDTPKYDRALSEFRANLISLEKARKTQPDVQFDLYERMEESTETLKEMLLREDDVRSVEKQDEFILGLPKKINRPSNFSWMNKATPVKDQKHCGSCWAFASVATVEVVNANAKGTIEQLSEQELVDCDLAELGCRGGWPLKALNFIAENGLVREGEYPYTAETAICRGSYAKSVVKISKAVLLNSDEELVADWVSSTGPVTFIMRAPMSLFFYKSGVYDPSVQECEQFIGYHALAIMGYGTEAGKDYWLVKNSWNTKWGDNGYLKLRRGTNACLMRLMIAAPIY